MFLDKHRCSLYNIKWCVQIELLFCATGVADARDAHSVCSSGMMKNHAKICHIRRDMFTISSTNFGNLHLFHIFLGILHSVHAQAGTQTQLFAHAACFCRSVWLKLTFSVNTPITNPITRSLSLFHHASLTHFPAYTRAPWSLQSWKPHSPRTLVSLAICPFAQALSCSRWSHPLIQQCPWAQPLVLSSVPLLPTLQSWLHAPSPTIPCPCSPSHIFSMLLVL